MTTDPIVFEIHAAEYDAVSGALLLEWLDLDEANFPLAPSGVVLLTADGQALVNPTDEQKDASSPALAEFSADGKSLVVLNELEGRTG